MRRSGFVLAAGFGLIASAAGLALGEEGPDPAAPDVPIAVVAPAAQTAPAATDKATEPEPVKPIEYVEYRGIVFRTPDGLFEASLGFNLQVRFTHFDIDAAAGGLDANEFRVRRFKLFMSGFAFDPRLTWRFQADFASTAANRYLDDAWLNWKFADAVSAQFGQYKTPFSREELYNDGFLQFPERSIAVDAFKPSRDIGFMAAGSFCQNVFAYQAGVFGGDGQNTLRVSNHVMPMLRLVFNPLGPMGNSEADLQNHKTPALSFGANGFLNTLRKTSEAAFESQLNYAGPSGWLGRNVGLFTTGEEVEIESWGLDAQFKWHGFSVQAEGFWGQAEGDTSGVRLYAYGWYGQAGYMILPSRLDIAVRYAIVDYNRNVSGDALSTVTAATSYYFRRNSMKLVLDYTRTHRQRADGSPANDQAFLVQAQLMP
jgi:phosphate-selective porin OprO and OprP